MKGEESCGGLAVWLNIDSLWWQVETLQCPARLWKEFLKSCGGSVVKPRFPLVASRDTTRSREIIEIEKSCGELAVWLNIDSLWWQVETLQCPAILWREKKAVVEVWLNLDSLWWQVETLQGPGRS